MTLDQLFVLCTTSVLPFWVLLGLAPTWKWTHRLVHSPLAPILLGLVYVALLVLNPDASEGGFETLEGVRTLFTSRTCVLIGWVHYLVFDLFVGAWIARDAARLSIHRAAVFPCLFFTLMLGPSGLLSYLVLRLALRRKLLLDETPSEPALA